MRVGLAGNPVLCHTLSKLLPSIGISVMRLSHGLEPRYRRVGTLVRAANSCHVVHAIGYGHPEMFGGWLLRRRVIRHWIGSDVIVARGGVYSWVNLRCATEHVAVCEGLASELTEIGVHATVVPLYPPGLEELAVQPLPRHPAILTYWRDDVADFYGADVVRFLASKFATLRWYVVGARKGTGFPQNVRFLGWIDDLDCIWPLVSAYFRFTKHDGLPKLVLEALARGKYVLWNQDLPGVVRINNAAEASEAIRILMRTQEPNVRGTRFVSANYNSKSLINSLRRLYGLDAGD